MDQDKITYLRIMGFDLPIHQSKLMKYSIIIYLLLTIFCIVSVQFFGYEMTNADIPGGLVAGFLLAYLITIL